MDIKEINAIYQKAVEAGEEWSDANAAADLLEETKKTLLAELTVENLKGNSKAAAETLALCHESYLGHIQKMVEARKLANRARVKYDQLKMWVELKRSVEATRRAETRLV